MNENPRMLCLLAIKITVPSSKLHSAISRLDFTISQTAKHIYTDLWMHRWMQGLWATSCDVSHYKQQAPYLHIDVTLQTRMPVSVPSKPFHPVHSYRLLVADGSWDTPSHWASYQDKVQSQQYTASLFPTQEMFIVINIAQAWPAKIAAHK